MKAVEEYIKEHTRITYNYNSYEQDPIPWLTPNDAKEVSQIAREETIKEVCEWLYIQLNEGRMECGDIVTFIKNLKRYLESKL